MSNSEAATAISIDIPPYIYDKVTGYFFNLKGEQVGSYTRKYGRTSYKGRHITLSRLAFFLVEGWWPDEVDHRNGNTHDDRWDNLRASTRGTNAKNRRAYKTNTSGYKGVSKDRGTWRSEIQVDGKRIFLGSFKNKHLAAQAYNKAAVQYHGEFSSLNDIKEN